MTKNFRMAGLRLGWVVASERIITAIEKHATYLDGGPSTIGQMIALQALQASNLDKEFSSLREIFKGKRGILLSALTEMGMRPDIDPEGAFYVFAPLSRLTTHDDRDFFRHCLERKIILVPGSYFGLGRSQAYNQYVRISYGMSLSCKKELIGCASSPRNASRLPSTSINQIYRHFV